MPFLRICAETIGHLNANKWDGHLIEKIRLFGISMIDMKFSFYTNNKC